MRVNRSDGYAAVQWVVMISLAMVLLSMIANMIAIQYGGGAVRVAMDEGSRWGSALGRGAADCEERASEILRGDTGLLRGSMGDNIAVSCSPEGDDMVATGRATFTWWIGGLPDVVVEIEGRSVIELPVESS